MIEEQGDTVFVSESLDAATTATLEKEVFAARPQLQAMKLALLFLFLLLFRPAVHPGNVVPSPRR